MTSPKKRILRITAITAACCMAPAAAQAHGGQLPDAEILVTDNTAVITDPADPRLDDELRGFERKVERIIRRRRRSPRGVAAPRRCLLLVGPRHHHLRALARLRRRRRDPGGAA
jgi:hypothetical protein